jgi:predicted amidohydrolase
VSLGVDRAATVRLGHHHDVAQPAVLHLRGAVHDLHPQVPGCGLQLRLRPAELAVFAAGHELVLTADGDLALGCCYDLAFPQFCAGLADAGARALFFPMAWEQQRAFVFEGIVAARAIENLAYVACANQTGTLGLTRFHGGSRIIDPVGRTVAQMEDEVGIISAEVDLNWVTRLRSSADPASYPLLADRRPQLAVRRGRDPVPAGCQRRWTTY